MFVFYGIVFVDRKFRKCKSKILNFIFLFSWSEKKKVQPTTTLVPIRDQRKRKTINESEYKSHVTTNTSINITNASSDSQSR